MSKAFSATLRCDVVSYRLVIVPGSIIVTEGLRLFPTRRSSTHNEPRIARI